MLKIILSPTIIKAAGTKEKIIEEYFGRVNSQSSEISIARMKSPQDGKNRDNALSLMNTL